MRNFEIFEKFEVLTLCFVFRCASLSPTRGWPPTIRASGKSLRVREVRLSDFSNWRRYARQVSAMHALAFPAWTPYAFAGPLRILFDSRYSLTEECANLITSVPVNALEEFSVGLATVTRLEHIVRMHSCWKNRLSGSNRGSSRTSTMAASASSASDIGRMEMGQPMKCS